MANIADLRPIYSGPTTDTGDDSLGDEISTDAGKEILSQTASAPTNVTGVVIDDAMANDAGDGTLAYTATGDLLSWTAPGTGAAYSTDVSAGNGTYVLGSPAGFLIVTVTYASLPVGDESDTDITIATRSNELWDNISALESLNGDVEYRCFYLLNTGASTLSDVRVWIRRQPTGQDEMDIALDPAGIGDGSTDGVAIGPLNDQEDSTDLLSALTFTRPASQSAGLVIGNIPAGDCAAVWMKRTVTSDTTQQELNDLCDIGYSALI